MKRFSALKAGVATVALAMALGMVATSASAKDINLCHLEGVSAKVIAAIRERDDFPKLLQQVTKVCPASAVTLTAGATASINGTSTDRYYDGDKGNAPSAATADPGTDEGTDEGSHDGKGGKKAQHQHQNHDRNGKGGKFAGQHDHSQHGGGQGKGGGEDPLKTE